MGARERFAIKNARREFCHNNAVKQLEFKIHYYVVIVNYKFFGANIYIGKLIVIIVLMELGFKCMGLIGLRNSNLPLPHHQTW